MNYLLHNLGYDKPVSFREIVLRAYHNNCIWLRDTWFDRLDLYNYEKWLPNIQYEYDEIKREQKWLKRDQDELASLTDEKLQEMYSKKIDSIKVLHNCTHSYHVDVAEQIRCCIDEYDKYLKKWLKISNTPKWLTTELIDIYECAMKDLKEHNDQEIESVERMHNEPIPTFEEFESETIERLQCSIAFHKLQIESHKRSIKIAEQQISDVKQIFAWLDEIEEEK